MGINQSGLSEIRSSLRYTIGRLLLIFVFWWMKTADYDLFSRNQERAGDLLGKEESETEHSVFLSKWCFGTGICFFDCRDKKYLSIN